MKKILLIVGIGGLILFFFLLKRDFKKSSFLENPEKISIGVINGTGDKLAASLFVKYLQKGNFLVSYVIEIKDTFEKTMVIEHIDKDLKNGKIIQRYLEYKKKEKIPFWQIPKLIFWKEKKYPQVYLFLDSTLNLSASIILGKDYFEIIKNGID